MKYQFKKGLIEGVIESRPNRFIMLVKINGKIHKCHCPATGRIGNIQFKKIPCLLSKTDSKKRKTQYTVEAISLDSKHNWIGINQNKANDYVEFFLKTGQLKIVTNCRIIKREQRLGNSRIDFKVGNTFIEVKTPLIELPYKGDKKEKKFNSFDRLIKHFNDLSNNLKHGGRAIVLLCYMFDAKPFKPRALDKDNAKIHTAVKKATEKGVGSWQVNLKIDKKGVRLIKYFRLRMF